MHNALENQRHVKGVVDLFKHIEKDSGVNFYTYTRPLPRQGSTVNVGN